MNGERERFRPRPLFCGVPQSLITFDPHEVIGMGLYILFMESLVMLLIQCLEVIMEMFMFYSILKVSCRFLTPFCWK